MCRFVAALLCLAGLSLGAAEPVFRIKVTMAGRSGEASFSSSLEIGYAPCAAWVGGSGGWVGSPDQYLAEAGGLAAIRPGMSLPFYAATHNGSASGSDGTLATVVTTGPGFAHWKEWGKVGQSEKQNDPSERPSHHQSARFYRTTTGARIADFDLGHVSAGLGGYIGCMTPYALESNGPAVVTFSSFELTNKELANWKQVDKTKSATFTDENGSVTVTAHLYAELEDPGEVDVEVLDDYDSWTPQGNLDDENRSGNSIRLKAKVRATGLPGEAANRTAQLFFELAEVSAEPGVCLNWPLKPAGAQGDLRLVAGENPSLTPDPQGLEDFNLKSKGLVKEAVVKVSAFDFGAWGLLKVRAEDKAGRPLKVTYRGKVKNALALPKDEDHNHIADAWQEAKGVFGLPSNWDEAEVAGQDKKGDGLTLYQKYRGLVVLGSGGRSHLRPEPREKVHFVIDPAGLVDLGRLQAATGLRPYKVLEAWTRDRQVDVHAGHAKGPGKFASAIQKDLSVVDESSVKADPEQNKTRADVANDMRAQWAKSEGLIGEPWTPRRVDGIVVFSGRIHDKLCRIRDRMLADLRHPEQPEARDGVAWMEGLGMGPKEKAQTQKQLEALSDQAIWALVKPVESWLAIHELSHAVGVDGHTTDGKEDEDCANRVPACPMQYNTWQEKRRYLLFGELGGTGKLCNQAPHHCWRQVSPKD